MPPEPGAPRGSPTHIGARIAAAIVAVEALIALLVGGWLLFELAITRTGNARVAAGSGTYFLLTGLLLGLLGVLVARRHPRSYAPAVFLQALALPMAFSMWQGGFFLGAIGLAALAAAALVSLLHPSTRSGFGR